VSERLGLAPAAGEVFHRVADLILQEALELAEVQEVAHVHDAALVAQQVAHRRAVGVAAGQGREVLEAELSAGLLDGGEDEVGGVEAFGDRARRGEARRPAAAGEFRLEGDPVDVEVG